MNKAYLGIDYGRKRIGLAISEAGLIARPLRTIENKGEKKNLTAFTEIIKEFKIGCAVIGLPVHKNISMGDEVRGFAKCFESLGIKVVFQNEMLSSVEAEDYIHNTLGITDCKKIVQLVDSVAAAMVLNDYLSKGEK